MNLLADENVDRQIADSLRLMGHNVEYVAEMDAGISDDEVLKMANEKTSLLLTADKDFGELVFRPLHTLKQQQYGVSPLSVISI